MPAQKNQEIVLTIHALSSDGNGVGRTEEGLAVFVPAAAAGDVLRVRIVKAAKQYAYGRIEEILTPAPSRQAEDCPIARLCGGCDFRHISYEAELAAKRGFVRDALRRIGHLDADVFPVLPAPLQEGYRNKVQVPVAAHGGQLTYGFYAARSHRVIPCEDCRLQPKEVNAALASAARALRQLGAEAYDETTHRGLVRHMALRRGYHSGEILLCLVLTSLDWPQKHLFAAQMAQTIPHLTTVVLNQNKADTNVIFGEYSQVLYGPGSIQDTVCGVPVRLDVHSFSQINTPAAEQLFARAAALAEVNGQTTLLDLYCGTGVIGLSMAARCRRLIGVEAVPQAVESARRSARQMGLANATFLAADAGQAAQQLAREGCRPNVVLTDPPRKGMDEEARRAVLQMAPQRIVMISCNAATLARDLACFTQNGYLLHTVQPADLFPRTKHVECLCLLQAAAT